MNCVCELSKRRGWIDMCATDERDCSPKQEKFSQLHCPLFFFFNVIPQIGHLPGLSDLIWGCMGQVYVVAAGFVSSDFCFIAWDVLFIWFEVFFISSARDFFSG